ncbi:hypothetical protein Aple_071610 [Acrocarpospora pleiomorpha]|uniref:Uncharacterized protein n=1 Tax=Acrocarpospora pleiomorpha TaxID=90975 RepID=A0A5M3XTC5_9ACTN|nr:hypothetical protein Aple_071610 [Acrocarpospora pleiomorpha]
MDIDSDSRPDGRLNHMGKTRGEPGAERSARRVREGVLGKRVAGDSAPRPRAYLTPDRAAIFLVAGDKAGQWSRWYDEAIPLAEARYSDYRAEQDRETDR